MRSRALAAAMVLGVLTGAPGAQAEDPPNFDFLGYCIVPTSQGGTLIVRSVLTNGNTVPTPIALDFNNNQYTLVLTATLTVVGPPSQYSPATVLLYQDPLSGGTLADYSIPGSFVDGTLILSGVVDGNLTRNRFTSTLGNYIGKIDFTGGTRLGDLQTTQDWPIGGGWSRNASVTPPIPPGYNEQWDGKIDNAPVAVEQKSWGSVKELYRR